MQRVSVWKRIPWFASVILALLCATDARAQQAKYFIFPAFGGSVAYDFNNLKAAVPGKYHTGFDIYGPGYQSTYILASSVGTLHSVTINGQNDHGLGNCVILRHTVVVNANGGTMTCYTLYAHLDAIANDLKAGGMVVKQGQVIGIMGSSGYGKARYWGQTPHLHFEVKTAGVLHNPNNGGPYWGYTPDKAEKYGYVDPALVIGNWYAR